MSETQLVKSDPVDYLCDLFSRRGAERYCGEPISQLEHALQSAHAACQHGADDAMIVAALLHDIGYLLDLLDGESDTTRRAEIDRSHQNIAAQWLARYYPPSVTEPIALHVAAKRFLCAVEPDYLEQLCAASVQSLTLQGGPMDDDEVEAFASNPYSENAIALRRWDDAARVVGLETPTIDLFRPQMQRMVTRR